MPFFVNMAIMVTTALRSAIVIMEPPVIILLGNAFAHLVIKEIR